MGKRAYVDPHVGNCDQQATMSGHYGCLRQREASTAGVWKVSLNVYRRLGKAKLNLVCNSGKLAHKLLCEPG